MYQRHISVRLPARCKYYPTCSAYAVTALERHGVAKGLLLFGWRFLRCNPWAFGGIDYVPLRGQWRPAPYHQMSDAELAAHWAKLDAQEVAASPDSHPPVASQSSSTKEFSS